MSDQLDSQKKFQKLRGWLLVFVIANAIFMVCIIIGIVNLVIRSFLDSETKISIIGILPYLVSICISLFFVIYTIKKPSNALFQIRNTLRIFAVIGVLPLAGLSLFLFNSRGSEIIIPLMFLCVLNEAWLIVWYFYFKRSRRVAVYFGLAQSGQLSGNTAMQDIEKALEQEIINAFVEQNALSKKTAVAPECLSVNILDQNSKYAATVSNLRYMRRLIKEVSGKYYYEESNKGKYIGNLPIKFFKVIGIILLVCLVLFIVAIIMMRIES